MPSENQTIDIQTMSYILTHLVTEPQNIEINRTVDEQGVLLSVKVDPKDMGILIGRNGVMANSIKTILRAIGKANDMNVRVEFLEPDGSLKYAATKSENHTSESTEIPSSAKTESSTIDSDLDEFVIN